ncbi:hypothetical protein AAMO2058_000322800 [Amorphochlora amoebiformis]
MADFEDPFADILGDGLFFPNVEQKGQPESNTSTMRTSTSSIDEKDSRQTNIDQLGPMREAQQRGTKDTHSPQLWQSFNNQQVAPSLPTSPPPVHPPGRVAAPPGVKTVPRMPGDTPRFPAPQRQLKKNRESSLFDDIDFTSPQALANKPIAIDEKGHPHSLSERRRSTPSIPHYHTRRQRSKSEIYTSPDLLGVLKEEEELPKSSAAKGNNPTSNYKDQVLALREMGFTDQVLVLAALEKHKGNIGMAVETLLHHDNAANDDPPLNTDGTGGPANENDKPILKTSISMPSATRSNRATMICSKCGVRLRLPPNTPMVKCGKCKTILRVPSSLRIQSRTLSPSAIQNPPPSMPHVIPQRPRATPTPKSLAGIRERKKPVPGSAKTLEHPPSARQKPLKLNSAKSESTKDTRFSKSPDPGGRALKELEAPHHQRQKSRSCPSSPKKANRGLDVAPEPSVSRGSQGVEASFSSSYGASQMESLKRLDNDEKLANDDGHVYVPEGKEVMNFDTLEHFGDLFDTSLQPKPTPKADFRPTPKIDWSQEEREKRARQRKRVVAEMITTEETYCAGLKKLISNFVYPLQGQIYIEPQFEPLLNKSTDMKIRSRVGSKEGSKSDIIDPDGKTKGDNPPLPVHNNRARRYSTVIRQETKRAMARVQQNKKATKKYKAVMESSDIVQVFSNIELIFRLNQTFLSNLKSGEHEVGNTFHEFAQYFKMYMPYVQNHDNATRRLKELNHYRAFRRALEEREKVAKTTLSALLILPIQRIPRYKLLLETVIKNTHPEDPAYSELKSSLDLIVKVAKHINESINKREQAAKLAEIQAMFGGHVELVAPHRRFIMRQSMKKLTKGGSLQDRVFFLFTDILLYGSNDVTFSNLLRLRQIMPIDKSFLVSEVHRLGQSTHLLYVSSSVKNITMSFENEADKNKWKEALTRCMADRRKKIGFNYMSRGSALISNRHNRKLHKGAVFHSYSYGSTAEETTKTDTEFYEKMRHIVLTRSYFEDLSKQVKNYLAEQQSLVKASTNFAVGMKGDYNIEAQWFQALGATSHMAAVHSHEMLRWKSVTELLIDSITWVLKGPVSLAERTKDDYEKKCYELQQVKRLLDNALHKKTPDVRKVKQYADQKNHAKTAFELSKKRALRGARKMDHAIHMGFIDKLKLFVQVQADFHKDCYYDIRDVWAHLHTEEAIPDVSTPKSPEKKF